jgi:hypothetical protein
MLSRETFKNVAYLDCNRQHLGAVVEAVAEPQEPPVGGNGAQAADDQGAASPMPVAVRTPFLHPAHLLALFTECVPRCGLGDALSNHVAHEIYDERRYELGHVRLPLLHATICAERFVDGFEPEPAGPGDRLCSIGRFLPHGRLRSIVAAGDVRRRGLHASAFGACGVSGYAVPGVVGDAPQAYTGPGAGVVYHDGGRWALMSPECMEWRGEGKERSVGRGLVICRRLVIRSRASALREIQGPRGENAPGAERGPVAP